MKLSVLSQGVFFCDDSVDREILSVTDQSEQVFAGSLFVAIPGRTKDGHAFLLRAVERGAVAAVVSEAVEPLSIPVFHVSDTRKAFALLCGNFYQNPARRLILTGITGTNGKTSTAYMLEHCFLHCGKKSSLIGTVQIDDGADCQKSSLTTPDPSVLHRIFSQAVKNGCTHGVMEVSSQSLDQSRTEGIPFALGVFTNLTVDHLDYHGSMQAYRDAKLKLFTQCERALINSDSDYSSAFLSVANACSYSASHDADFSARRVHMSRNGVSYLACTPSGKREVFLPAWGRFSVYNSLAALSAAELLGLDPDLCAAAMADFPGVPGRMEAVRSDLPFRLLIDYAHTPDGLKNVLRSVRDTTVGRVILLFGCGGDRDAGKRPEMGRIASQFADEIIITTDNPRSEDPESIIRQILQGVREDHVTVIPDRTEAIRAAIRKAQVGDTVLLAGKGHERVQIFADGTVPYDERLVARKILEEEGY